MAADSRTPLPLPTHDLHILLVLLDEPKHGYAIIQDVTRRTDGATQLGTSTVYAALKRMLSAGLIAETARPSGVDSEDERRRYYRATAAGQRAARVAAREIGRLHGLLRDSRLLDRQSLPTRRRT